MSTEYIFNYDEVKRRFESVPLTNSTANTATTAKAKVKFVTYKTHFQPRTKSVPTLRREATMPFVTRPMDLPDCPIRTHPIKAAIVVSFSLCYFDAQGQVFFQ